MEKEIKIYRLLQCFDIIDEKGKSILKNKDANTVVISIMGHKLKQEDIKEVAGQISLNQNILVSNPVFHHLFYSHLPVHKGNSDEKTFLNVPLQLECKWSHSKIYNLEDNRVPPFLNKNAVIIQGIFAKVLRLLYKIRNCFAFLCANFRM